MIHWTFMKIEEMMIKAKFFSVFRVVSLMVFLVSVGGQAHATLSAPVFKGDSYIDLGTPDALQIPSNAPFTIEA